MSKLSYTKIALATTICDKGDFIKRGALTHPLFSNLLTNFIYTYLFS